MAKHFLHYDVSDGGIKGDSQQAMAWIQEGQSSKVVATINAHSTCTAEEDAAFAAALRKADILLPDGASVVLASRILGQPLLERVSGYDFFRAFSDLADQKGGVPYFFLGSSVAVLKMITDRLANDYPNIRLAGTLSPPYKPEFSSEDNDAMIAAINTAKPDVLWVGMTAPKQEKWVETHRAELDVGFTASIGAVFDFYAGTKARAPVLMQTLGFEWLHRLQAEPRRVWRRYLLNNPRFLWLVLRNKFTPLAAATPVSK